jgi:hypothetical protein
MSSRVKVYYPPGREYVQAPNAFARSTLDPGVIKLLLYLASHTETYTIHNVNAAETLGVTRNTFAKWITSAEATPHLIRCATGRRDSHGNADCVLHVSLRGFTQAEQADIIRHRAHEVRTGAHGNRALEKTMSLEDVSLYRSEPSVLPNNWAPNHAHKTSAANLGLDAELPDLSEAFREWATESGELRADWDRTFGAYLNDYANARADVTFAGVSEYL